MPAAHRSLILVFLLIGGCSEPDVPSAERVANQGSADGEIAVSRAPMGVANDGASASATRPVGPHGQHDPHGALDPERLVKVALQHDREGRREQALKTLAEGIAKYPQAARLYAVRASLRLQMQQVSAALQDLERAVTLAPDDASIRVNRAQAYRAFGRHDEAMADLDKAVAIAPDLIAARFNRGALAYAQNEFDLALADFDHCIAVDPHTAAPYFNRASTYWELGRQADALRDLDRFIELTDNPEWRASATELKERWQQVTGEQGS